MDAETDPKEELNSSETSIRKHIALFGRERCLLVPHCSYVLAGDL